MNNKDLKKYKLSGSLFALKTNIKGKLLKQFNYKNV